MVQKRFLVLLLALISQINCFKIVSTLDDAKAKLEELTQLVQGHIYVADGQLDNLHFTFLSHTTHTQLNGEIEIKQNQQNNEKSLDTLKNLALAASKNISSCLGSDEDRLLNLGAIYMSSLADAVSEQNQKGETVLNDARYSVDVVINKVHTLNNDLNKCSENDDQCINQVVDEITNDTTSLPLTVEEYVSTASDQLDAIKVTTQEAADQSVAAFVKEGGEIIEKITDCVNNITK